MGTLGHLVSVAAAVFTMAAMASIWQARRWGPRRTARSAARGW